jgi:large subunit ribosomal protein L6
MSRIGQRPIQIPKGVTVGLDGGVVRVKGPKGELARPLVDGIALETADDGTLTFSRADDAKENRAKHGLMRALVQSMVVGVSQGFERRLEIHGVGYKAETRGNALVLSLGFSHTINFPFPPGIKIAVEPGTPPQIVVTGTDKEQVGQTAANLRGLRPPDHYKGKGVRHKGEYVRIKVGKTSQ